MIVSTVVNGARGVSLISNAYLDSSEIARCTQYPIPFIAGWSSLAARKAHNLEVPGSNPGPATIILKGFSCLRFENSLIERQAQRPAVIRLNHRQRSSTILSNSQRTLSSLDRFCYKRVPSAVEFSMPDPKRL